MPTIYTEVEIDVDLGDFESDDLIDELENRGIVAPDSVKEIIDSIYTKRKLGQDYERDIENLIYTALGRM